MLSCIVFIVFNVLKTQDSEQNDVVYRFDRQSPRRQRRRWSGPNEGVFDALEKADLTVTHVVKATDRETAQCSTNGK